MVLPAVVSLQIVFKGESLCANRTFIQLSSMTFHVQVHIGLLLKGVQADGTSEVNWLQRVIVNGHVSLKIDPFIKGLRAHVTPEWLIALERRGGQLLRSLGWLIWFCPNLIHD